MSIIGTTKFSGICTKRSAEILFIVSIFFTSCMFMDTALRIEGHARPDFFFMDFKYVWQKFVICIFLPFAATLLCWFKTKNLVFIGDATAFVMTAFSVLYIVDALTLRLLWRIERSIVIYHLGYGLVTYFMVFLTVCTIMLLQKRRIKGYSVFCRTFFAGIVSVLVICFVTIYFVNRNYGSDYYIVNLVPFQGEFKTIYKEGITKQIVRDIGNVFFFTAMAMLIKEFSKKNGTLLCILVPALVSVLMELFQYFTVCGDADIDDVIANVFGAVIGLAFYKLVIKRLKEKELC